MLKKSTIIACFILIYSFCFGQLIINEFLYDPAGTDSGKEWVELLNISAEPISLTGWSLEKAGTEFSTIYTFSETIYVEPQSYFLIGEIQIQHADYILSLGLQNGGTATDGIRLVSPDQNYTDTALYDSPNENNLPDDENTIASEFLDDISDGKSWARVQNGVDTNSILDWCIAEETTPGFPNSLPVDIAIDEISIVYDDGNPIIMTTIHNLSTFSVYNEKNSFSIILNDENFATEVIPTLNPSEFYSFEISIPESITYCKIKGLIHIDGDINLMNNESELSYFSGVPPILLNEIMIQPQVGGGEWIEILSTLSTELSTATIQIVDNSERTIEVMIDFSKEYQIICSNKSQFLEENPTVQENLVCEAIIPRKKR
jgi:hypothetical protein